MKRPAGWSVTPAHDGNGWDLACHGVPRGWTAGTRTDAWETVRQWAMQDARSGQLNQGQVDVMWAGLRAEASA